MCHAWVRCLIRWDEKELFSFAPLESEAAKTYLGEIFPGYLEEDTIVFFDEGHIYVRSDAALRIISLLKFPLSLLKLGLVVPKSIRDAVYAKVAANRFKFGERFESCPLPPVDWRDRFLN